MDKNLTILFMLVLFIAIANVGWAETSFEVTGIMGGNPPIAIVNGQVVQKGGKVGGAEIVDISNNSVTLKYQNQVIVSGISGGIQKNNTQTKIAYTNQVSQPNSSNEDIDEKIQQRIDDEYKRQQEIDAKWDAKEQAEKDRKTELKVAEIEAQADVDAEQGRLYDAHTDAYERGTLRFEQKDDDKAMEDSD